MRPLENPVPQLRIRIPPDYQEDGEEEYDRFSDNESDGSVDLVDWFDEADPDWEQKLQIVTVFWSWTVTVRLPKKLYHKLIMDVYVLDKVRQRIFEAFIWKNEVRFECY